MSKEFVAEISKTVNGIVRVGKAYETKRQQVLKGEHIKPDVKLVRVQLDKPASEGGIMTNYDDAVDAKPVPESLRTLLSVSAVNRSLDKYLTLMDTAVQDDLDALYAEKKKDRAYIEPLVYQAVGQIHAFIQTVTNYRGTERMVVKKIVEDLL